MCLLVVLEFFVSMQSFPPIDAEVFGGILENHRLQVPAHVGTVFVFFFKELKLSPIDPTRESCSRMW